MKEFSRKGRVKMTVERAGPCGWMACARESRQRCICGCEGGAIDNN